MKLGLVYLQSYTYVVVRVSAESKRVDRYFGDEVLGSIKVVSFVDQPIGEEQDDAIPVSTVADQFVGLEEARRHVLRAGGPSPGRASFVAF